MSVARPHKKKRGNRRRALPRMAAASEACAALRGFRPPRATAATPARPRAPPRQVGPPLRGKAGSALQARRTSGSAQASRAWAEAPTPEAWQSAPDTRPLPLGGGAEASPGRDDGAEFAAAPVPYDWRRTSTSQPLKEMPPPPRGVADDAKLSNPLVRFHPRGGSLLKRGTQASERRQGLPPRWPAAERTAYARPLTRNTPF